MNRNNQILSAILLIQLILLGLVFWPGSTTSRGGQEALLGEFDSTAVVALTISDTDDNQSELAKNGGNWVLASADDYPADDSKITPLLDKLKEIKSNRLVTKTDSSHGRLKVADDDFERLVELRLQDGTTHKLYVGTSGGPSATHIRHEGQSEVYLTGELSMWDVNPQASSWIDTLYVTLPQTATLALKLENQNGTFEFVKEGENWTMQGLAENETFKASTLTSMLDQITSLRMSSPIGKSKDPSFGLDAPRAVVTLQTTEGERILQIGAQQADGNDSVVKWSESEYYVHISNGTANNFADKTRDEFLELPPTPVPEG